jgi:hypothetical protein
MHDTDHGRHAAGREMSDRRRTVSAVTANRTAEVPADALREMVGVVDGLVRALEGVAASGGGYGESARQDVQTLRELRGRLVAPDADWMAGSSGAARSWYVSITFAFTEGSSGRVS